VILTTFDACRFVCAASRETAETVVFSSYYSDRRGNHLRNVAKIWEVARATSAASSFFEPTDIGGLGFVDGGTGANNPIRQLWTEAVDVFAEEDDLNWRLEDNIQRLVSIGTGKLLLKAFSTSVLGIFDAMVAIATNTEQVADLFEKEHTSVFQKGKASNNTVSSQVGLGSAIRVAVCI
jgi:patatin-like phospholipase/acyl hydrolase